MPRLSGTLTLQQTPIGLIPDRAEMGGKTMAKRV